MRLRVLETRLRALFQRIEAAGHGRLGGTPAAAGQGRLVGTPAVAGHGGLGGTPAAAGHGVFGRAPETTEEREGLRRRTSKASQGLWRLVVLED